MIWEYAEVVAEYERDDMGLEGWEAYAVTVQTREECDSIGRVVSRSEVVWFHMRRQK